MDNLIAKHHMSAIYARIDNSVISLWIETAAFTVALSIMFLLALKVF